MDKSSPAGFAEERVVVSLQGKITLFLVWPWGIDGHHCRHPFRRWMRSEFAWTVVANCPYAFDQIRTSKHFGSSICFR